MEAEAVDKLIEKAKMKSNVALAIGEAIDITLKAANLVTVPVLDARLAAQDAKMEARFASLEKSIASTKVWAVYLYAALVIGLFGALAAVQARSDQNLKDFLARSDENLRAFQAQSAESLRVFQAQASENLRAFLARSDENFNAAQARSDRKSAAMQALWEQRFRQREGQVDPRADTRKHD